MEIDSKKGWVVCQKWKKGCCVFSNIIWEKEDAHALCKEYEDSFDKKFKHFVRKAELRVIEEEEPKPMHIRRRDGSSFGILPRPTTPRPKFERPRVIEEKET